MATEAQLEAGIKAAYAQGKKEYAATLGRELVAMRQRPKEDFGALAPSERKSWDTPPSWGQAVQSGVGKGLASIPDVIATAPENVMQLGKAAYGTGMTLAGRPDLAPDVSIPTPPVQTALEAMGAIPSMAGATPMQRIAEMGISGAAGGGASALRNLPKALAAAKLGGLSGVAGQAVQEATDSPIAALAAGLGAPALRQRMAGAKAGRLAAQEQEQAVRDATLRAGQELGLKVMPSEAGKTRMQSVAGATELQKIIAAKNQPTVNAIARRSVGLPEGAPLTEKTMKDVRKEAFNEGMKPLKGKGFIPTDDEFQQDLMKIVNRFQGAERSFPGAVPEEINRLVSSHSVNRFDVGDALERIQDLRDNASAAFKRNETGLGNANRALATALENQIERGIGQWTLLDAQGNTIMRDPNATELMNKFRDARKRMAIAHTLEDSIRVGTGSVDAEKLAQIVNADQYLSGELRSLAEFSSAFPKSVTAPQDVPLQTYLTQQVPKALLTGAGSLAAGIPGAITAATVPTAARAYLTSGMGQRGLRPDYARGGLEALTGAGSLASLLAQATQR